MDKHSTKKRKSAKGGIVMYAVASSTPFQVKKEQNEKFKELEKKSYEKFKKLNLKERKFDVIIKASKD